jgi:hypothetical protein
MEENNTTGETATETPTETPTAEALHDYAVVVGLEILVKSRNQYDAKSDAEDLGRALMKDISADYRRTGMVISEDYAPKWMEVPKGINFHEARRLMDWAVANADRASIDWAEFAEEFIESDKWEEARRELESVPLTVFVNWLSEGNGGIFEHVYDLTAEGIRLNAEACEEQFLGSGTREEFTAQYYEDTGALSGVPSELIDAIDWDAVWYSSLHYDTNEVEDGYNGTYFFRNY